MAVQRQHIKTTSDVEAAASQEFGAGLPQRGNLDLLVRKLEKVPRDSGSWEWVIVEQCGGQSIRQIVKILYRYELRKGASLVDIGLWKSLFDRSVLKTVYELVHDGYIDLVPDVQKIEGRGASSGNK